MTNPETTALALQVARVAALRVEAGKLANQLAELREAFEVQNEGLIADLAKQKNLLSTEELRLRDMAVAEFEQTGETKPTTGVSIRRTTQVEVDERAAFEWAKTTGLCLSLDLKAVKALAKHQELPFARASEVPQATIATDLSAALAIADVTEGVTP